jgi:uncharacterized protein (TIRG00374 family)
MQQTVADPCIDCLGRDVFDGSTPEAQAPPGELRNDRSLREIFDANRKIFLIGLLVLLVVGSAILLVPKISGLGDTLQRIRNGNRAWLLAGVGFEVLSIASYVAVFRATFSCEGVRIGWRSSAEITLAGIVATKLLAAGGAGGIALTAWALRASGLKGRTVARRITAFEILLYSLYMLALVVFGAGLALHVLPGSAPAALTWSAAILGAAVIVLALAMRFAGDPMAHWLRSRRPESERLRSILTRLADLPAVFREGMVTAASMVRERRLGLLGAVGYWAFDIAALWAAFQAFGVQLPLAVVVLGYYIGTLANLIPVPGGVGGVEGGLIATFLAFGVDGGVTILAVLSYRVISYWLPVLPGLVAYVPLRRRVARWRGEPQRVAVPAA